MWLKYNGNWVDEVVIDVMFNYLGVMYLSFDEWRKNVLLCCNFNLIFRKSGVENVLNVEICLCFLEYDG